MVIVVAFFVRFIDGFRVFMGVNQSGNFAASLSDDGVAVAQGYGGNLGTGAVTVSGSPATPGFFSFDENATRQPRYVIEFTQDPPAAPGAQPGVANQVTVSQLNADGTLGIGSGWLTEHAQIGGSISLRVRRNSGFHLPSASVPMILLGNGTGLAGLRSLLKARIARLYAERHGVAISPEQVILTCGASPGLVLALSMAFAPGDTVAWFMAHGLSLVEEPDGRLFPRSNRSSSVVACLRTKVATLGDDRFLAPDLTAAAGLVACGDLARASGAIILRSMNCVTTGRIR